MQKYPTFEDFDKAWQSLNLLKEFQTYASEHGVKQTEIKPEWVDEMLKDYLKEAKKDTSKTYSSYSDYVNNIFDKNNMLTTIAKKANQEDIKQQELAEKSNIHIESNLKGFIARNLYGTKYYYKSVMQNDETLIMAIELIKDDKQYNRVLQPKSKE